MLPVTNKTCVLYLSRLDKLKVFFARYKPRVTYKPASPRIPIQDANRSSMCFIYSNEPVNTAFWVTEVLAVNIPVFRPVQGLKRYNIHKSNGSNGLTIDASIAWSRRLLTSALTFRTPQVRLVSNPWLVSNPIHHRSTASALPPIS